MWFHIFSFSRYNNVKALNNMNIWEQIFLISSNLKNIYQLCLWLVIPTWIYNPLHTFYYPIIRQFSSYSWVTLKQDPILSTLPVLLNITQIIPNTRKVGGYSNPVIIWHIDWKSGRCPVAQRPILLQYNKSIINTISPKNLYQLENTLIKIKLFKISWANEHSSIPVLGSLFLGRRGWDV